MSFLRGSAEEFSFPKVLNVLASTLWLTVANICPLAVAVAKAPRSDAGQSAIAAVAVAKAQCPLQSGLGDSRWRWRILFGLHLMPYVFHSDENIAAGFAMHG